MRSELAGAKRVVVKIGSSLLTNSGAGLDRDAVSDWAGTDRRPARARRGGARRLLRRHRRGDEAAGLGPAPERGERAAGRRRRGPDGARADLGIVPRRARAAQAQVLLTHEDLGDRRSYLIARTTLKTLVSLGVVPVINENDSVVVDEIRFGDNDTLASLVTNLIEADALAILTDQKGLYSADPRRDPAATLVARADAGDAALEAMAGGAGSEIGSGGMITKVRAARRAARSGAHTIIASGREPRVVPSRRHSRFGRVRLALSRH